MFKHLVQDMLSCLGYMRQKILTIVPIRNCIICGSSNLRSYLDLGNVALANSYLSTTSQIKKEKKYPLVVTFCSNCSLSFLAHRVNPTRLFSNYAYFSSASKQIVTHFEAFAKDIWHKFPMLAKELVVDIASNDGVFLTPMKHLGSRVLGVDPAKNIATYATKHGIPTVAKFFTPTVAQAIKKAHGQASIICATNVFAHTADLHGFVTAVEVLLKPKGIFIIQFKYLADLINQNAFDTVYHEHISYFLLAPIMTLLSMHNLEVFDVEHVEAEGGSLRVFVARSAHAPPQTPSVTTYLATEKKAKLYTYKKYESYIHRPVRLKKALIKLLNTLKKKHKRVVAYGASAKGGNMLQYCEITTDLVEYIVDSAPAKIGKLMPGSHVPIVHPDTLKKNPPDYILLLAWNLANSIMKHESWFTKRGGKFIVPIPKITIV